MPRAALQLLPGDGKVGAPLVGDAAVAGVMFTGSTEVARSIQRQLAERLDADGRPPVADRRDRRAERDDRRFVGACPSRSCRCARLGLRQRRPALLGAARALPAGGHRRPRRWRCCKGAMAELGVGNPDRLSADVGPVITAERAEGPRRPHRARCARRAMPCTRSALPRGDAHGTFVPPTLIEIDAVVRADARGVRAGAARPALPARGPRGRDRAINATGYGLTFGVHTRIDETIERATAAQRRRQRLRQPQHDRRRGRRAAVRRRGLVGHRARRPAGRSISSAAVAAAADAARRPVELPGPVGERNTYGERPKGTILCVARDPAELRGPAVRRRRRRAIASPTIPRRRTSSPRCSPAARTSSWRSTSAWPRATGRSCPSTSRPIPSSFWATRSRSASTPPRPAAMPA